MSDLKHRTPEALRRTIQWCERTKAENDAKRADKLAQVADLEAEIEEIRKEVSELGRMNHNIGQKEVWARKYLAEKEIAAKTSAKGKKNGLHLRGRWCKLTKLGREREPAAQANGHNN